MTRIGSFVLGAACALACASCAKQVSRNAMTGALDTFNEAAVEGEPAGTRPVEAIAMRSVHAAVGELSKPETIAEMNRVAGEAARAAAIEAVQHALATAIARGTVERGSLIETAAAQAAEGARAQVVAGIQHDLGQDGPLTRSLAQSSHAMAGAAVDGGLARLFPECAGNSDPRCLERGVSTLSAAAARGLVSGFIRAIRWTSVAFAFALGTLLGVLVTRRRRTPDQPPRPRRASRLAPEPV